MYTGFVIGLLVIAGASSVLVTWLTAVAVVGGRRGTAVSMMVAVALALLYRIVVQPSADRIVPELQHLEVGDRILMMPTMGFEVRAVHPPH